MADNDKDAVTAEKVVEAYEVELAGLSESEREQVVEALSQAELTGELGITDVNDVILDAQGTEQNRQDAEEAQREQAEAADRGDYEEAREQAEEVQDNLQEAEAKGGEFDEALRETGHDVLVLSEAEWQQDIADEAVVDAVGYAEAGSEEGADAAGDDAEEVQDAADDYAEQGDQDGVHGDQSIYSDG